MFCFGLKVNAIDWKRLEVLMLLVMMENFSRRLRGLYIFEKLTIFD